MIRVALKPAGKSALWIGGGAIVGLAVGGLLTNPGSAGTFLPAVVGVGALFVAAVVVLLREKGDPVAPVMSVPVVAPPRASRAVPAPLAAPRNDGLSVLIDLPDVPDGFPCVVGEREAMRVVVSVESLGVGASGAAVRVTAQPRDGARLLAGEGVAGGDGTVVFNLAAPGTGELILEAEARLEGATGSTSSSVSIVRYEEEIARLFGEFRQFAITTLGPDAESSTARELAERLRPGSDAQSARALLEIARIYELVAYGERDADRRLYLALMSQLIVLERADLPAMPSGASASATLPGV